MKSLAQHGRVGSSSRRNAAALDGRHTLVERRTIGLMHDVCTLAGKRNLITDVRRELHRNGVLRAIEARDTPTLFNWMVRGMAFQGISDFVAHAYMEQNGSVTWHE